MADRNTEEWTGEPHDYSRVANTELLSEEEQYHAYWEPTVPETNDPVIYCDDIPWVFIMCNTDGDYVLEAGGPLSARDIYDDAGKAEERYDELVEKGRLEAGMGVLRRAVVDGTYIDVARINSYYELQVDGDREFGHSDQSIVRQKWKREIQDRGANADDMLVSPHS